jgi:hypothetical protein
VYASSFEKSEVNDEGEETTSIISLNSLAVVDAAASRNCAKGHY